MKCIGNIFLLFILLATAAIETKAQRKVMAKPIADTVTKKQVSTVDVSKQKNEVTITYTDNSIEVLTEQQAQQRGLVHSGGFSNFKTSQTPASNNGVIVRNHSHAEPLYVLDGMEITKEEMLALKPTDIESMNVLKNKSAIDKYGVKGKNGVVEITLKNKLSSLINQLSGDSSDFYFKRALGIQEQDVLVSFTLVKQTSQEEIEKMDVTGGLSPAAKMTISDMRKGDTIILQNILVKRNGVETKLPAKVHTLL